MLSSLSSRTRDLIWWLIPFAALVMVLGLEVDWGDRAAPAAASPLPAAPKQVAATLLPEYGIEGGVEARRETADRTLFNPTRRPAPVPAQEAAKPQMPRGQFALTGTTVAEGKSTAFLREVNGGKSRRVREGDTLNGMLVAEVKADRVKLTMGAESEELVLKVAANSKPTPAMPVPPVAAAAPSNQAGANTPDQGTQTLLERRRAARAAANAQNQEQAASAPAVAAPAAPMVAQPPPAALAAPAVAPPPPAPGQPGQPAPGWGEVFRRYQQRSSNAAVTK